MLVVVGIIGLVVGLSLPFLVPMMRTRKLDSAVDMVKSACILARSKAIQERRMINVTFLQQTDATHGPGIVITDYNALSEAVYGIHEAGGVPASVTCSITGGQYNGLSYAVIYDPNQTWFPDALIGANVLVYNAGLVQTRTIWHNTNNEIFIIWAAGNPPLWNSSTTYLPGNVIMQGGYAYICVANNTNFPPPNLNYWQPYNFQPPWNLAPGNFYLVPGDVASSSAPPPFCAHYLGNYTSASLQLQYAPPDARFNVLKMLSLSMGEQVRYLPEGCQFNVGTAYYPWSSSLPYVAGNMVSDKGAAYECIAANINSEPPNANWLTMGAWTYVFLPNGQAWTLPPNAGNNYSSYVDLTGVQCGPWYQTTYAAGGTPIGPTITSPDPGNQTSSSIVVYATTGQVVSR